MASILLLVSACLCLAVGSLGARLPPRSMPTYVLNLDLPPEQRWTHIVKDYIPQLKLMQETIEDTFSAELLPLVHYIARNFDNFIPDEYSREIHGIAKEAGMDAGNIFLINCIYELTAYCTSIVAQDPEGRIWHGRNFDYGSEGEQIEWYKNVSINVDYQKNGKTVYFGNSIAGYVGVHTGQRPGVFTLSTNERDKGGFMKNFFVAMFKGGIPNTMLMRQVFETATTFEKAVELLSSQNTVATSYFILGGPNPGQGVLITKERTEPLDTRRLDPNNGRWYLVETNYDHWEKVPDDDNRRGAAILAMNATGQANINNGTMWNVMNTDHVLNGATVLTALMTASDPTVYRAWIRDDAKDLPIPPPWRSRVGNPTDHRVAP